MKKLMVASVVLWKRGVNKSRFIEQVQPVDILQPGVTHEGAVARTSKVAAMAHAAGMPCTPHSANLSLVTICTMHLLGAIPTAAEYLEFSIEGPDYNPGNKASYWATRLR